MRLFQTALGIDFKTNHLILTLLRKSFGKLRLVDYRIYPRPAEGQWEIQEAHWIGLISAFISENEASKDRVAVSIPREKTLVRFLRLPIATRENLRKVLEYEAPKLTPFDKEDFWFDYQVLKEDGAWVYLIAVFVKKEDLEPYLNLLKKVGIQPVSVLIPGVSALNLFLYHEGDRGNEVSVLLDINDPYFEMNILEGRDWKDSFHLPLPAEKREEMILHTYKRGDVKDPSPARTSFFVYGLDATEKVLPALEATDGMKWAGSPPMSRIDPGAQGSLPDSIYPSLGLPLAGLTDPRFRLNLLPPEMRRKVRDYGKPVFLVLLGLAVILSLTWGGGVYSRYQKELEMLRAEVKKKKPEVEAVEKITRQSKELITETADFERITQGGVSALQVLKELTQVLPASVWVWQFKFSGREVEVSGFADSASELISLLDKSPLFEKVEFLAPVTKERERRIGVDRERERFKIKMRLEGMGGAP
ncbi:MAG: PilN domain-containing protein [Syntrophaceae bacterium]|nr:PilN domain-containing protein [Syntrophaceae bacterium]